MTINKRDKWLARPASRIFNRLGLPPALGLACMASLLAVLPASAADYNITSYGAVANDTGYDTLEIQAAIDAAYNAGGGRVIIPSGKFISTGVILKNNVTLRLDTSTSVLEGSPTYAYYRNDIFINASGGSNKRIEGPGRIDGVNCYNANGEEGFRGPHCIDFTNCNGFSAVDITITNSGNFALRAQGTTGGTQNVTIQNVKIRGGHDGLHINGATNVTVTGCDFQTGDDAFAGNDNRTVTVTDCQINSSCNGMRLGVDGLTVKRCRFWGPGQYPHRSSGNYIMDSAYCYMSAVDRNPTIPGDNVLFEYCAVENTAQIFAYSFGSLWQEGQVLKNVTFRNVTATGIVGNEAFKVNGDTGKQFNLTLEAVDIGFTSGSGRYCISLNQFGTATMKAVTLRNGGDCWVASFSSGNYVKTNRVAVVPSNANPIGYSSIGSITAIALPFTSGRIFSLTPQHAKSKCLDVANFGTGDGANAQIWAYGGGSNQKWQVTDVTGGGVYELTPQHATSKRLDVNAAASGNGVNVQIWSANGGNAQRWRLLEQGNGIYELTPLCAPYRSLDVSGASTADGANVCIWQDADGNNQRWKLQTP